jgi:hypothetical protein
VNPSQIARRVELVMDRKVRVAILARDQWRCTATTDDMRCTVDTGLRVVEDGPDLRTLCAFHALQHARGGTA